MSSIPSIGSSQASEQMVEQSGTITAPSAPILDGQDLEGRTDMNPSAPVLEERSEGETDISPSAPALEGEALTPEVSATVEKKQGFESLIGRIFIRQEGESRVRAVTIGALALLLLPITILTAIFDLGRLIAFSRGYIDGKSYSLIDKTSGACKSLADKVRSIYNSYMHPEQSIEKLNEKALAKMRKHAKMLVQAYEMLNAPNFSDPKALKGAESIPQIQKKLLNDIQKYVTLNATSAADFYEVTNKAFDLVEKVITEAAGTRVYIAHKVRRLGPPHQLKTVMIKEFGAASTKDQSIQDFCSSKFKELAKDGTDFIAGLKMGLETQLTNSTTVKNALNAYAVSKFQESLEEGLQTAVKNTETFVKEAVESGLLNEVQGKEVQANATAGVLELARAAAKDVARTLNEETSQEEIDQRLAKMAEELIENGRLSPENESQFLTEAKAQIKVVQKEIEAERLARVQKEQEALELQEKQEVEAAQALKEAEEQAKLMSQMISYLEMVSPKQTAVSDLHREHNALREELKKARVERMNIQKQKVRIKIGKKESEVTALKAEEIYSSELDKILKDQEISDEVRRQKIETLNEAAFDQNAFQIIEQLRTYERETIKPLTDKLAVHARKISMLHNEVRHLLAVYEVFKKNNVDRLKKDQQEALRIEEKAVFSSQKGLNKLHDKLLQLPFADRKKGKKIDVEKDPELNRSEVMRLLEPRMKTTQEKVVEVEEKEKVEEEMKEEMEPQVITESEKAPSSTGLSYGGVYNFLKRVVSSPFGSDSQDQQVEETA